MMSKCATQWDVSYESMTRQCYIQEMHDPYLTSVCLHMLDLKEIVHTKSKGTDSKKKMIEHQNLYINYFVEIIGQGGQT